MKQKEGQKRTGADRHPGGTQVRQVLRPFAVPRRPAVTSGYAAAYLYFEPHDTLSEEVKSETAHATALHSFMDGVLTFPKSREDTDILSW